MAPSFSCPGCGAVYEPGQVPAGTTFECGACGGAVTAPAAVAGREPRETRAPARTAARGGTSRSRPAATAVAQGRAPRAARPAPAAKPGLPLGAKLGLVLGGLAAVVVVAVLAFGGDAKPAEAGGPRPSAPPAPAPDPVREAVREARAAHDVETAEGAWAAKAALEARLAAIESSLTPAQAGALRLEIATLRDKVLAKDPDHAAARRERSEWKYGNELEAFASAAWLPENERARATRLHERLVAGSKRSGGWVAESFRSEFETLLGEMKALDAAHAELTGSPWYQKARKLEQDTIPELDKRFADSTDEKAKAWTGATMVVEPPFAFFFQNDRGWDPQVEKKRRFEELASVHETIMSEFGGALGLKPLEGPIPVIYLRNKELYRIYKGEKELSSAAHYEPWSGRLVVDDSCNHETIRHEGTHQSMWGWTRSKYPTEMQSYWFQEGVAEWYSTTRRVRDASGRWTFILGKVNQDHINGLVRWHENKFQKEKLFSLKELLGTKYMHKGKITEDGREMLIYAQGWFLIYFLNHYNVDGDGYVHPDRPGIYRDKWQEYVRRELEGKTGREVFQEALGIDDAGLEKLEAEYWKFFDYVRYKLNINQLSSEGQLVPWDQYVNQRGQKTGEKDDDLLVRPKR